MTSVSVHPFTVFVELLLQRRKITEVVPIKSTLEIQNPWNHLPLIWSFGTPPEYLPIVSLRFHSVIMLSPVHSFDVKNERRTSATTAGNVVKLISKQKPI